MRSCVLGLSLGALSVRNMAEYKCQDCGEVFDSAKSRGMHRRWNHSNPWEDKEKLESLYVDCDMSTREIAEEWDCGSSTIQEWVDRHNLVKTRPWRDEETLREYYVEKDLSIPEMAKLWDCGETTVQSNLKQNGIERQKDTCNNNEYSDTQSHYYIHERIDGEDYYIRVSNLVAYGHKIIEFDDLINNTIHIHHKNGITWLNNPSNLQRVTEREHAKIHATEGNGIDY